MRRNVRDFCFEPQPLGREQNAGSIKGLIPSAVLMLDLARVGRDAMELGQQDQSGQCQIYAWMVVFIRGLVIDQDKRAASMSHCGFPKILKKRYPYALWLIGYQSESCRHCIAFTSDTLNDVLRVLS